MTGSPFVESLMPIVYLMPLRLFCSIRRFEVFVPFEGGGGGKS
jgi:hypothetical protein